MAGLLNYKDDPVFGLIGDTYKGIGGLIGDTASNVWGGMDTMDKVALITAPIPIAGDVIGAMNDARYLYKEPTLANAGMMGLGLVPYVPSLGMIKTYHGTPHKVDKFRMDKIGTGEGAQSYGHGLYFAENADVAGQYKRMREGGASHFELPDGSTLPISGGAETDVWIAILSDGDDFSSARSAAQDMGNNDFLKRIDELEAMGARSIKNDPGYLYNVELDVNHEDLLDWDAPLSEQPEKVKELAKQFNITTTPSGMKEARGSDIYRAVSNAKSKPPYNTSTMNPGEAEGSKYLKELGIPGIRYLDQGSRGTKEGTRNLVIFDEDLIKIADDVPKNIGELSRAKVSQQAKIDVIDEYAQNHPTSFNKLFTHGGNTRISRKKFETGDETTINKAYAKIRSKQEAIKKHKEAEKTRKSRKKLFSPFPSEVVPILEKLGYKRQIGPKIPNEPQFMGQSISEYEGISHFSDYYIHPETGKTVRVADHAPVHQRSNRDVMIHPGSFESYDDIKAAL